ncbi:hypothetical protein DZF79_04250 [Vibrio parahaemolyticus]|nr:hypothetical protein [Vibrio parahaemolyticus]
MNILITLECKDSALNRSRTICAKYLPQIGSRTYSGHLCKSGLDILTHELIESSSKNNTILIHKADKRGTTLIKSIGSMSKIDQDCYPFKQEFPFEPVKGDAKQLTLVITLFSALLHDIGKSSIGFQKVLLGATNDEKPSKAIVRHEAYSALLCCYAFEFAELHKKNHWADALTKSEDIRAAFEFADNKVSEVLSHATSGNELFNDLSRFLSNNKISSPEIAKIVTWLTLTHHKLPNESQNVIAKSSFLRSLSSSTASKITFELHHAIDEDTPIELIEEFMTQNKSLSLWRKKRKNRWIQKVSEVAQLLLEIDDDTISTTQLWSMGELYCRPALVFSDYYGSSKKEECEEGDFLTTLYANTTNVGGKSVFADSLEKHTLRVTSEVRGYFNIITSSSFLGANKVNKSKRDSILDSCVSDYHQASSQFKWQAETVTQLKQISESNPSPTIVFATAGTGYGKTMGTLTSALALSKQPRVTVALGRRGLSRQTFDEYCSNLGLSNYSSLLIGGETLRNINDDKPELILSSGTDNDVIKETDTVEIISNLPEKDVTLHKRIETLTKNLKERVMISSPISVLTIDHLTGATNISKSSHLTNIVRPITSDLILDEIDDYSIDQFGAISWLTLLHGAYGRNVVVSSATLTPKLADLLFQSFQRGVKIFQSLQGEEKGCNCFITTGESTRSKSLPEPTIRDLNIGEFEEIFREVNAKAKPLKAKNTHSLVLSDISESKGKNIAGIADPLFDKSKSLHRNNKMMVKGKGVSFGVIKLNRTKDVICLSEIFANRVQDPELNLKVVCYHSNFDNNTKEHIESWMSSHLNRKGVDGRSCPNLEKILDSKEISECFVDQRDLCVVFVCTNIIEVGRDVDFDWGIYEPNSFQGLVQFKGRINRHRNQIVSEPNMIMLSHTISELEGGKFSHFGVGTSSIDSPRNKDKISALVNKVNKASGINKEELTYSLSAISNELISESDINAVSKWSLNTQTLRTNSSLIFSDALLLAEKILIGKSNFRNKSASPLISLPEKMEILGKTRNWFQENPLRETSDDVTIFSKSRNSLGSQEWYYLKDRGKLAKTPFTVNESLISGENWLFKEQVSSISVESSIIKFKVKKDRLSSSKPIELCARTGVKDD